MGNACEAGFCSSHGCANGAKGSPLSTVIPALLKHSNFELRPLSTVIKVNLDSDRKRATGVTYIDASGRELEQPADLVVLATYTFNNVRLLLVSGIGKPYDPVSNTGVVGSNYSYQTGGKATLFFEDQVFNPFMGGGARGTTIDEFNGDNFDHAGLGFFGGAYMSVVSAGAIADQRHARCRRACRSGARPGRKRRRSITSATSRSRFHGGSQSMRTNYLDLDPTYTRFERPAAPAHDLRLAGERSQDVGVDHEEGGRDRESARAIENGRAARRPASTASCPIRARTMSAAR